jgi:hypothetical protein
VYIQLVICVQVEMCVQIEMCEQVEMCVQVEMCAQVEMCVQVRHRAAWSLSKLAALHHVCYVDIYCTKHRNGICRITLLTF